MSEQENTVSDLQRHSAIQDAGISNLETKFEMFMQSVKESNDRRDAEMQDFKAEMRQQNEMRQAEMRDFKNEMRQQNEMRATEIAEIRQSIKEIYTTTDAKVSKIESNIQSMTHHIQILTITAMGGIIAAGIGIAAMVWSVTGK